MEWGFEMMQAQGTAAVIPPSRRLARKQRSALAWLPLLALCCVVGAGSFSGLGGAAGVDLLQLDAPPLLEPRPRCLVPAEAAGARASAAERAALDKIARYPFAPGEGLRACELLAEAESCASAAGDQASAARLHARASAWRSRLEREYRDRLTRYRRARSSERPRQALADVLFLLELLAGHDGPFPARLRQIRLELEAAIEAAAS
jgi:hypothetical protein